MDKETKKPTDNEALPHEHELMTLVELQKFLAEELASVDGDTSFNRAFMPLTDGLGLISPVKKEAPAPAKPVPPPPSPRPPRKTAPPTVEIFDTDPLPPVMTNLVGEEQEERETKAESAKARTHVTFFTEEKSAEAKQLEAYVERKRQAEEDDEILPTERLAAKGLAAAIEGPVPAEQVRSASVAEAPARIVQPPSIPAPTFMKRFLAGLLDEIFVLTIWLIALAITSNALSIGGADMSAGFLKNFSNPMFLRFAALEFATVWLAYLAIGLGVLDMTFGMWVWGMRLRYNAGADGDGRFLRKVTRIVLTFFFFAPVFPLTLLSLRIKGKNLLDLLSGTGVYCSTI